MITKRAARPIDPTKTSHSTIVHRCGRDILRRVNDEARRLNVSQQLLMDAAVKYYLGHTENLDVEQGREKVLTDTNIPTPMEF